MSMAINDVEGAHLMAFVLPDKQYKKYIAFKKLRKEKEAEKIFNRFAFSLI